MDTENKETTITESLLPAALRESLSEESLKKVEEKINQVIESKVSERVQLAVESAQANFDAEANKDLDKLVVKIEEAHKLMAMKAMKSLKENYNNKLSKVRNYYRNKVDREANLFKKNLVENLSNYIDSRIDKAMPYQEVKEAFRNNTAMKVLESFRQILNVGDAKENAKNMLKKPILEAKQMIAESNKKNNTLAKKNKELAAKLDESNKQLYLEKKMKGLDADSRSFMVRVMKNASLDFIKENFDYALSQHKEKLNEEKEVLKQRALSNPNRKRVKNVSRSMLVEHNTNRFSREDGITSLINDINSGE